MGILRTDKISGLETPTAVTGSVVFDGTGDYLAVTPIDNSFVNWWQSDFTVEAWIYADSYADWYHEDGGYTIPMVVGHFDHNGNSNYWSFGPVEDGKVEFYYWKGSQNHTFITSHRVIAGEWSHIAMSYSVANGAKLFINGKGTDYISLSGTPQVDASTVAFNIGQYYNESLTGYISNLRILNGTALYTSDFTPPTHELEVIGDTVLLCCNNPDSAGADGTGKTITANGNAAASTFSPGLTKDFTFGTEFRGVTTFDTQGYFVPPSGTTEQRYAGSNSANPAPRGLRGSGQTPSITDTIDFVEIATTGNAVDFGNLTQSKFGTGGIGSPTRGLFCGGGTPTRQTAIDYVTIATEGNAQDFGDITGSARTLAGATGGNVTRGLTFGGALTSGTTNVICAITISSTGSATDFGNCTKQNGSAVVCSPTRAVSAGGDTNADGSNINTIDFVTIQSMGNSLDFGDLLAQASGRGVSSITRGLFSNESSASNRIQYVTIATTGNSVDFGDLITNNVSGGCASYSSLTRGCFAGLRTPSLTDTIEYFTMAALGNATDFGNLTQTVNNGGGCSNGHGGLG